MNNKPFKRYDTWWPANITDADVELYCYRYHPAHTKVTKVKTPHKRSYHMKQAIKLLWPEKLPNGKRGYIFSKWSDERIEAWCDPEYKPHDCDYQTWWGPSSTGKSTDAAVIVLTHWLSAPDRTTVTVCSTTSKMLEKRIWGEILKYYNLHRENLPGTFYKSKMAILLGDEDSKNGIFGIAIQKGTIEEAVGNIIGVHNDFNVLVIDEQQATRPAATEAFDNLSTGMEAKFLGMGNPVSRIDALGRSSKPKAGWKKLTIGKPMTMRSMHWETEKGKTLFFSGLDSPAVDDPDRYPFLLNSKQIDAMRVDPGEDSPRFWSQRIGFVAPEGLVQTVLSETMVNQFKMQEKAEWRNDEYTMVAGVDEGFTTGGDRTVLAMAKVGELVSGEMCIEFLPHKVINPAVSKDVPLEYHLANEIIELCKSYGVRPENLGVDTSATQTAFASIIENEWKAKVFRCTFGGSATELPISAEDSRPGKEAYKNRVTELWYNVREFGRNNQIRGLGDDAVIEFCNRLVLDDVVRVFVEPKKEMKLRTGESPDIADAHAVLIAVVREVLNVQPGGDSDPFSDEDPYQVMRDLDIDNSDENYLHSSLETPKAVHQPTEADDYVKRRQRLIMQRIAPNHF